MVMANRKHDGGVEVKSRKFEGEIKDKHVRDTRDSRDVSKDARDSRDVSKDVSRISRDVSRDARDARDVSGMQEKQGMQGIAHMMIGEM